MDIDFAGAARVIAKRRTLFHHSRISRAQPGDEAHQEAKKRAMKSILLTVAVLSMTGLAYASTPVKIGSGVIEAIQRQGSADVVVALTPPSSMRKPGFELSSARLDIAARQKAVLSEVDPREYREKRRYQAIPAFAGRVFTRAALNKLAGKSGVERIDLDVRGAGGLGDSVPLIGADKWKKLGITGAGVVVAVLDSGIEADHPDLSDDLIAEECFNDCPDGSNRQSGPGSAADSFGHGTAVTGVITSNGEISSAGVAPGAKIVAIKVLDRTNSFWSISIILDALDFLINNRRDIKIVNMSFGTDMEFASYCDTDTAWNLALASAVGTLRRRGVTTFASSMNEGSGTSMGSPACIKSVISVGATDKSDQVAEFTNSNSTLDIMAPGVVVTDFINRGTISWAGTSFSTPHGVGCAALFIQSGVATTPGRIEARLKTSPVNVIDPKNGLSFPRIDCSPPAKPYCAIGGTGTDEQGRRTLTMVVQDIYSGLASLRARRANNVSVSIPAFTPGSNDPVLVTATMLDQIHAASVALRITNQDGLVTDCDPLLTGVVLERAGPAIQTFTDFPRKQSKLKLINGVPGLHTVTVYINGKRFNLDHLSAGEQRDRDFASAMRPGRHNQVTLMGSGNFGDSAMAVFSD